MTRVFKHIKYTTFILLISKKLPWLSNKLFEMLPFSAQRIRVNEMNREEKFCLRKHGWCLGPFQSRASKMSKMFWFVTWKRSAQSQNLLCSVAVIRNAKKSAKKDGGHLQLWQRRTENEK